MGVTPRRLGFAQMIIERELGLMDQVSAIQRFTAVEKDNREKRWFELQVELDGHEETFVVTNARRSPRKWRHLNTLINYLRAQCPNFVADRFGAGIPVLHLIFGVNKIDSKE